MEKPVTYLQIPIAPGEKIYVEDSGKLRAAKVISYDEDNNIIHAEMQLSTSSGDVFIPIDVNLHEWTDYLAFKVNKKEEL